MTSRTAKIAYIITNTNLPADFCDDLSSREVTALYKLVAEGMEFAPCSQCGAPLLEAEPLPTYKGSEPMHKRCFDLLLWALPMDELKALAEGRTS